LYVAGERDEAVALLRWARGRHPTDFWTAMHLGNLIKGEGQEQNAVPVDLEERIGCYRVAVALRPDVGAARANLGNVLQAKGQLDDAIEAFRQAIALDPRLAQAHNNLGVALAAKDQLDDAIEAFRKAIELDGTNAEAHSNLGVALKAKGKVDEAIACYHQAIALDPGYAPAHTNLGNALAAKGQLDAAIAAHCEAIAIDGMNGQARNNLGMALAAKGQLDDAIDAYRTAIVLAPRDAKAHYNLGNALAAKGQLDDAIAAYQETIRLKKDFAYAHCNLGHVLRRQGHFADALVALKRGHALGSRRGDWTSPSAQWVREAERMVELDARLSAVLAGKARAKDAAERLALAQLCQLYRKHYAAAARFYTEAFAEQPALAANLAASHRYNAACAAALAGCGQGKAAASLTPQDRARLRHQALDWLRADLRLREKQLKSWWPGEKGRARQALEYWLKAPDFAGVRRSMALRRLPAKERAAWARLWADLAQLRNRMKEPTPSDKVSPDN
jgi:tetratricopeptide (TPR) repeat protein